MIGFKYNFRNLKEIVEKVSNIEFRDIIITILGIAFIIILVYYIIPYIKTFILSIKEEKEKKRKKELINKIILQKNLEDIITKELEKKSSI